MTLLCFLGILEVAALTLVVVLESLDILLISSFLRFEILDILPELIGVKL